MNVKEYLDTVCEQIRFQKAHDSIKKELQDHITDQADALMQEGIEQQKAFELAVKEMGDPVLVGTELDRVHRPNMRWSFIVFVILFSIVNFSIRFFIEQNIPASYNANFINLGTVLRLVTGIVVTLAVCHVDFTILANNAQKIYVIYLAIMLVLHLYLTLFGITFNGARNYIHLAFLYLKAPTMIYFFPVVLVGLLYDCRGKSYQAILLCGASFFPIAFLSMGKGNNAAIFIVAVASVILILVSIVRGWFAVKKSYGLLLLLLPSILLLLCIVRFSPYVQDKLEMFYNAVQDPLHYTVKGVLQNNVKTASLFGMGELIAIPSGKIVQLPMILAQDFFTSYVLYYGGWISFALIFMLYFIFIGRGFVLTYRQKSQLGSMTAFAVLILFSLLTLWNVAVNSGFFIEFNPLEIPFFCYSGKASLIFFMLLGILLSVFRTGNYAKNEIIPEDQKNKFFRWKNGTLTIEIQRLSIEIKRQKKERDTIE